MILVVIGYSPEALSNSQLTTAMLEKLDQIEVPILTDLIEKPVRRRAHTGAQVLCIQWLMNRARRQMFRIRYFGRRA